MHPPIVSPYTSADQPKVVYVSAGSSFIGVVKRVGKLFIHINKQNKAKIDLIEGKGTDKQKLESLASAAVAAKDEKPEPVFLKATNRAIDKALSIALFLKEKGDLNVQLKTGTVAVVDDIVLKEMLKNAAEGVAKTEDEEEEPDTRVRYLSMLEVVLTMK